MNADFFTQLQRIASAKHEKKVSRIVEDVVDLFGPNFNLTMEEYFTELEAMALMARIAASSDKNFTAGEIKEKRDRLMAALAAVLEESTDVSKKESAVCDYHQAIFARLDPQDTIVSFNYDCVADHVLRRTAGGRWSAKYGYGFSKPNRIVGHEHWSADPVPKSATETLYLLKLHGSLNWQLPLADNAESGDIRFKQRLYEQNGTPRFTIIPPEFVKEIGDHPNFEGLWRRAERAIRTADVIALVGFSFTPTDLHVESLFRIALAKSKLSRLVIANPSRDHRRRIRSVFAKPLQTGCVVRQYDTIEDLASHLETNQL